MENWTSKEQTIPTAQLMVVMRALKTEMKMECYSVESLDLRKVQMTVLTKAESLGLMTAQMMEIPKDYCSVVKKAQLIK